MATYISLAFSASMLPGGFVALEKEDLTASQVNRIIQQGGVISCLNPSHAPTIEALKKKHGIEVTIPSLPPKISLKFGDSIVVLQVIGLLRLSDKRREKRNSPGEYTAEEIKTSQFRFMRINLRS